MIVERIAGFFSRTGQPGNSQPESKIEKGSNWWPIYQMMDLFRSSSGQVVTADTVMRLAAVYACVRVLSESMAQLPLHIYEKTKSGSRMVASDHALTDTIRFPNTWQTSFEYREMAMAHLCLRGNHYSRIVPGVSGSVSRLEPLHPDRMVNIDQVADTGELRYHYRNVEGSVDTFLQREIFHIRGLSTCGFFGLDPIGNARETFGSSMAADKYAAKFYSNDSKPSGFLSTDGILTAEAENRSKENWQAANAGEDNWHKVAVLQGGLKWQGVSISNRDSQFLEIRGFNVLEICRIFRVPPHMVAEMSRATFSNIEQQSIEFVTNTLGPWCRRWEEAMARDLITESDRFYAKFNLEGLLRGDSAARSQFYREMVNAGIMAINEVREKEDMNPIPGGDVHLVQGAMIRLEDVGKEPEPVPAIPPPADDDGEDAADDEDKTEELRAELAKKNSEFFDSTARIGELTAHGEILAGELDRKSALADELTRSLAETKAELTSVRSTGERESEDLISKANTLADQLHAVQADLLAMRSDFESNAAALEEARAECQSVDQQLVELAEQLNESKEQQATAAETAFDILVGHLEHFREVEVSRVREFAAKPQQFLERIEQFYPRHTDKLKQACKLPAELYSSLIELRNLPVILHVACLIQTQCDASKAAVIAIYDSATPEEFEAAIQAETETWDCEGIISKLKGE